MAENDENYAAIQRDAIPLLKRVIKLLEQKKPVACLIYVLEPTADEDEGEVTYCEGATVLPLLEALRMAEIDAVMTALADEDDNEDEDDGDIEDEGQA